MRKAYYLNNKDKILDRSKKYFKTNQKIIQHKNNERYKERRETDPIFKLSTNLKRNIRGVLNKNGFIKKSKTLDILGCSYAEFKAHLESKFEPWMNWGNYGLYNGELNHGWDIDHMIPSSSAMTEDDVYRFKPLH